MSRVIIDENRTLKYLTYIKSNRQWQSNTFQFGAWFQIEPYNIGPYFSTVTWIRTHVVMCFFLNLLMSECFWLHYCGSLWNWYVVMKIEHTFEFAFLVPLKLEETTWFRFLRINWKSNCECCLNCVNEAKYISPLYALSLYRRYLI